MKLNLLDFTREAKDRLINECIKCGNCITNCRIMKYTDVNSSPAEIQQGILDYLKGEKELLGDSEIKVRSCMRCYGCLDVKCPIDLDSMTINELVSCEKEERKETPWNAVLYPIHVGLSKKWTTEEEFKRITTKAEKEGADYLFFPGCNIYKQPDKLLNALTILDEIGNDYSFAPGMEYCCGLSDYGCNGNAEWLQDSAQKLMNFAQRLKIKQMVFWCPTCLCNLKTRIEKFYEPPFESITLGKYILDNITKLQFPNAMPQKVTYHEPCKAAYMGIDTDSVREILKAIPGTELIEMKHHGKNTMCCGCEAVPQAFESGDRVTVERINEAIDTGADTMIDSCHNCHWIFVPAQKNHEELERDITIENYSTYITNAMGKSRKDTLKV